MGKIIIRDDCLAPGRYVYLDYHGKNPFEIVRKINDEIGDFFQVTASQWGEDDFRWDNSDDPATFYARYWVNKPAGGKYSHIRFRIKLQGQESQTTKEGLFTLELVGRVVTEFEARNIFLRTFWWIYSYLFYDRRRRNYIEFCRDYFERFRTMVKEHYNLGTMERSK